MPAAKLTKKDIEEIKKQLQQIYDKISSLDVFNEEPDRVKRMQINLSFLKAESDEFMGFDNKPINIKKLKEQAEKKRKSS